MVIAIPRDATNQKVRLVKFDRATAQTDAIDYASNVLATRAG